MGNTMDPEKSPIISITLWQFNIAIENGPVEIVDLPSYKMVDLSIVMWLFTRGCIYIYNIYILDDIGWYKPLYNPYKNKATGIWVTGSLPAATSGGSNRIRPQTIGQCGSYFEARPYAVCWRVFFNILKIGGTSIWSFDPRNSEDWLHQFDDLHHSSQHDIYIYSNLQNDTNNSICHIPIIPITWFLPISFLTIPSTKFDFPKIKTVSLQPRPQGFRIWIIL